jgi:hypothetical protein
VRPPHWSRRRRRSREIRAPGPAEQEQQGNNGGKPGHAGEYSERPGAVDGTIEFRHVVRTPPLSGSSRPEDLAGEGLDHERAQAVKLLPSMDTDIVLERDGDRVIVDCKFYRDAFQQSLSLVTL